MDQRPESVDSPRQERCIFVVRRHDDAKSFEVAEVFREGQRYSRTTTRIGRVGYGILLEFWDIRNARILDAPQLLGISLDIGQQCRLAVDLPPINAIYRARNA